MTSANDALRRLTDGNARFMAGTPQAPADARQAPALADGQSPFAVIISCSDSRVPPEIVFDQGLGDLFMIRVAGNVIAPHQIGSVEYAVSKLGTRLVMVLGHTQCGAVAATLNAVDNPDAALTPGLQSLVDSIRPAVEPLLASNPAASDRDSAATRANARYAAEQLAQESALIAQRCQSGELRIVAAEYALETGAVTLLDDASAAA